MNRWLRGLLVGTLVFGGSGAAWAQADRWTGPTNYIPPIADTTVTGTATVLCPANANQMFCTCRNTGSTTIRLGDSSVTSSKGLPLAQDEVVEIRTRAAVYGISEGADTTVACLTEVQ